MMAKTSPVRLKAAQVKGRPITWAQISLAASEDLRDLIERAPKAAQLILALIERMEPGSGGVIVVSRTTMAELVGCSMPTIERSLRLLIDEGWVQRLRIGGASALAINHRVAWVGPRGDLQHAVFGATVIASRSEQDAIALTPPPVRPLPFMQPGEIPLQIGPGLDPPSQPELDGVPPPVAVQGSALPADQATRAELERLGQQRLVLDDQAGVVADLNTSAIKRGARAAWKTKKVKG